MNQATPDTAAVAVKPNQPSILYASPMSVLDITSGAALSMRTLLATLAAKGFRTVALQALLFDSAQGGEQIVKACEEKKDKPVVRSVVNGVEHWLVRAGNFYRPNMTCQEQEIYLVRFRSEIKRQRPDMIILWGGLLLEMTVMREAREAGIPVVFYLVNEGYKDKETFKYASVIVTDTQATADLYKKKLDIDCHPIGKFIDIDKIKAKERKPDFITFINPGFEKGVNVFMALATMAQRECPEVKFLVVQSRGRWGTALKKLNYEATNFPNVKVIGHQKDMRPVYGHTRALLLPSTWHESGARVIPEAQINGIPVLASNTGGSAELVGQGGIMFELSAEVREKKFERASEAEARPWLDAVKRVWHDQAHYQSLCRLAEASAAQHDISRNVDRFIKAVSPAVRASKGMKEPVAAPRTSGDVLKQALQKKQAKLKRREGKKK